MSTVKTTGVRRSRPGQIAPRVKLWLELNGERVFCPGMCQILEAVRRTGSIKEAAAEVQRSYRFVWGRLKDAERALGTPLVETRVGGDLENRSCLTATGSHLVESFTRLKRAVFDVVDQEFARWFESLPSRTPRVRSRG